MDCSLDAGWRGTHATNWFGRSENSFYQSQYPVFDVANEADVALEGLVLRAALAARSGGESRRLAREFVAVREARQRRLPPEIAELEAMTEMNEGLAQYAQLRATSAREEIARLGDLTGGANLSVRRRFYTTGSAMALLLDRLAGNAWKLRLMAESLTIQQALAGAAGYRDQDSALRSAAALAFDAEGLVRRAADRVTELRARRRRQADSLLARPGLRIEIVGSVGLCGFDPQNMLAADSGVVLHTRWLRVCGRGVEGEFNTPVVEDGEHDTLRAVIGQGSEVRVTIRGAAASFDAQGRIAGAEDVRVESPGLTLRVTSADLERSGGTLRVRLRP